MTDPRRACCTVIAALAMLIPSGATANMQRDADKKPSLSLRPTPQMGFSPLRVRVVADVRGGPDDYAEFYCASIEWDWGDGTKSESSSDCDPYQPGKSEIRRRFTANHVYRQSGAYKIVFKLKQKSRQVGAATARVQVRSGLGEGFGE